MSDASFQALEGNADDTLDQLRTLLGQALPNNSVLTGAVVLYEGVGSDGVMFGTFLTRDMSPWRTKGFLLEGLDYVRTGFGDQE